jgi:formylglycine-generating enzyme required for sulfatase activity
VPKLPGLKIDRSVEGPSWVYRSERAPDPPLVLIEPAEGEGDLLEFEMGTDERRFSNEFPAHTVRLRPFLIGLYEVTNRQYRAFCDETERGYPAAKPYLFPNHFEAAPDHPVVSVTWDDAQVFCAAYGLLLPTEAQWEYAASGGESRLFPWGSGSPIERDDFANFGGFATTQEMGEADNDERRTRREFDGHNFTAEGGKHIAGVFGTYDHAGNVSEWCRDVFASYKDPWTRFHPNASRVQAVRMCSCTGAAAG